MTHPILILAALVLMVIIIDTLASLSAFKKIYSVFPVPFWCYFIPMIFGTAGLLPQKSPAYALLSDYLLPTCIFLLLGGTDFKSIKRIGPQALLIMLVGCFGTMLGGLGSYALFKSKLPSESWMLVGALTGSWTGGSLNMIAVKEALKIPDASIAPLIIIDAMIAYTWMAFLIWLSSFQNAWDRKFSGTAIKPIVIPKPFETNPSRREMVPHTQFAWIAGSILLSILFKRAGTFLPSAGHVLNGASWPVLLATTSGLLISLTPAHRTQNKNVSKIAGFLLFVLLASIGVRADLHSIAAAPVFLLFGGVWILIHGLVLVTAGLLLKTPLKLIATASQANIGGTVSAPMVGAVYHSEMAGLGLLMALLGNLIGTYLGLATALMAKSLS